MENDQTVQQEQIRELQALVLVFQKKVDNLQRELKADRMRLSWRLFLGEPELRLEHTNYTHSILYALSIPIRSEWKLDSTCYTRKREPKLQILFGPFATITFARIDRFWFESNWHVIFSSGDPQEGRHDFHLSELKMRYFIQDIESSIEGCFVACKKKAILIKDIDEKRRTIKELVKMLNYPYFTET